MTRHRQRYFLDQRYLKIPSSPVKSVSSAACCYQHQANLSSNKLLQSDTGFSLRYSMLFQTVLPTPPIHLADSRTQMCDTCFEKESKYVAACGHAYRTRCLSEHAKSSMEQQGTHPARCCAQNFVLHDMENYSSLLIADYNTLLLLLCSAYPAKHRVYCAISPFLRLSIITRVIKPRGATQGGYRKGDCQEQAPSYARSMTTYDRAWLQFLLHCM